MKRRTTLTVAALAAALAALLLGPAAADAKRGDVLVRGQCSSAAKSIRTSTACAGR